MLAEKRVLGMEEIEAQTTLELPDREMMALINVELLNGVNVALPIVAAANICGVQVAALVAATQQGDVTCVAKSGEFVIIQD